MSVQTVFIRKCRAALKKNCKTTLILFCSNKNKKASCPLNCFSKCLKINFIQPIYCIMQQPGRLCLKRSTEVETVKILYCYIMASYIMLTVKLVVHFTGHFVMSSLTITCPIHEISARWHIIFRGNIWSSEFSSDIVC